MEISPDTWHYRNYQWWLAKTNSYLARKITRPRTIHGEKPKQLTLCVYFWIVILRAPLLRFIHWASSSSIRAATVGGLFIYVTGLLVGLIVRSEIENPYTIFLYPLLYTAIIGGFFGLTWLCITIVDKIEERQKQTTGNREPSIVVGYVKAKKQKICPIITVKQGDNINGQEES